MGFFSPFLEIARVAEFLVGTLWMARGGSGGADGTLGLLQVSPSRTSFGRYPSTVRGGAITHVVGSLKGEKAKK